MNLAEEETDKPATDTAAPAEADAPPAGENEAASAVQEEAAADESDGEGLIVSIGEDAPPQPDEPAPQWVRDLRKQNRELTKRLKELEAERSKPQPETELPQKPTLEACDWDADKFEAELLKWNEAKRKADDAKAAAQKQQEAAQAAWDARLATYQERKQALPADDVDDAEAAFLDILTEKWGEGQAKYRWALLVDGADDPAMLVYALGKNPGRAKELAGIESLAKFAFTAAKLEGQVKTTQRKPAAAPEKAMTGTAPGGIGAGDATLERLRAEALRTGNTKPLMEYKRQRRAAGK